MRFTRLDLFGFISIFILSVFFVLDLFLSPARLASFDAPYHISNIAQFFLAIKGGDFPVVWTDGIGNYGLPMAIVAHQLTNYLGAIVNILTHNPLTSYKIVAFLGIFLSSLSFYAFLRIYFKSIPSLASAFLYTFSTYKIINFYIRGAMPEIFSAIFLPLILIGMYLFVKSKNSWGLVLISVSLFLLALNHPMMLLIYSLIYMPYLAFLLAQKPIFSKEKAIKLMLIGFASVVGVGMASYYLIPLNLELKYFYYGGTSNHLVPNFLTVFDFINYKWSYYSDLDIFTRGHIIFPGIIEISSLILGLVYICYRNFKERKFTFGILEFSVFLSILILLITTPLSKIFFEKINILSSIQFPWRVLSSFIFLPPIIFAALSTKFNKKLLLIIFVIFVSIIQFPQIYGKNYISFSNEYYYFSKYNPHSVLMNPIWTGRSEDYPVKKEKPEIIEGEGRIIEKNIKNSSRKYIVSGSTPLKMVDYTFYFPGWNLYIDNKPTPIEFQDPNYRGVITYQVPEGKHTIDLKFEDTKVRKFGKIVSIGFIFIFVIILIPVIKFKKNKK